MAEPRIDSGEVREFEIRLLGPIQALYQGEPLDLGGVQARSVFAALALRPNRMVPRGEIAAIAWRGRREDHPDAIRDLIANYVSGLRKNLRPAAGLFELRSQSPGFALVLNADFVDVTRFRNLLRDAERAGRAADRQAQVTLLERAVATWCGEHLALADAEAEGLRAEAEGLQDARRSALVRLAALYTVDGQAARAAELLTKEARRSPADDDIAVGLVEALSGDARPTEAFESARQIVTARRVQRLPAGLRLLAALNQARAAVAAANGAIGRLRQLPADPGAFTGRIPEQQELLAQAEQAAASGGPLVISALHGMAGIGKTALALHVAHQLADQFPDEHLFLNLRGFTRGMDPQDPADALADVLRAFGVLPQMIPDDTEARAALYRDRLADKRALIILDNARTEAQVRPLLPGHPGCLVIITSRMRLKALDDAHLLALKPLAAPDAVALLRTVANLHGKPVEEGVLGRLADLCGRLPLALRIAGALLRNDVWTLDRLTRQLEDQHDRLDTLDDNDQDRNLAALFTLSYQALTPELQLFFRCLGMHPGLDTDPYASAALLDSEPTTARRRLERLVDHSLLSKIANDRYSPHDLLRAYADSLTHSQEEQRGSALARLLDYYEHTAAKASVLVAAYSRREPPHLAHICTPPLRDAEVGLAWLRSEQANLRACFDFVARSALEERIVAFGAGLAELLRIDGPFPDAEKIHTMAATAAEHVGDQLGLAAALADLGRTRGLTGDHLGALNVLTRGLQIHMNLGDRHGQASMLTELGIARTLSGDYRGALDVLNQALQIHRYLDDARGHALALEEIGRALHLTGDYPGALDVLTRALQIHHGLRNRRGQANTLYELGHVRYVIGDANSASHELTEALDIYRDLGNRHGQANAITALGRVQYSIGKYSEAADAAIRGVEIYRALGHPHGHAYALFDLGRASALIGEYPSAIDALTQALEIHRGISYRPGQANILAELGHVRHLTGDYPGAIDLIAQALALYRDLGDRGNEAYALNYYAAAIAAAGDIPQARSVFEKSLQMNRELNKRDDEALSLEGIGECLFASGETDDAVAHLRQALDIFQQLGLCPDIGRVTVRLATLESK